MTNEASPGSKSLGAFIRETRRQLPSSLSTQKGVAERSGLPLSRYLELEKRGVTGRASVDELVDLASGLKLDDQTARAFLNTYADPGTLKRLQELL